MRPIKNKKTGVFHIDARWSGYPRIQVSTRTRNLARAKQIVGTLERLKTLGRRDILGMLGSGTLKLDMVHDVGMKDIGNLDAVIRGFRSQPLGVLVEEWLSWLRCPSTLAPRTRRPYSLGTIERYAQSWQKFFAVLKGGPETPLTEVTKGCVADYRAARMRAGASGATVNRDMVALQSFLRWAKEEKEVDIPVLVLPKEAESAGRERWLSAEEIAMAKACCDGEWWILFAMLIHTGMRVGEAQGLRWGDIDLQGGVIAVRDHIGRRLKTKSSNRDVPISDELASLIIPHAQSVPSRPIDPVFIGPRADRRAARAAWLRVLRRAGVPHATVHDLRHTFAVHALQAGIPLSRVQKWLGHSTATMTLRYASHVPHDYFRQDAELLSRSLAGLPNQAQLRLLSESPADSKRFA